MLGAPAGHIAGGSDEVMKNIIGERVLGLPGEPRPGQGRRLARRAPLTRADRLENRRRYQQSLKIAPPFCRYLLVK